MATLKQIAANRANAERSTGPRTRAGKARSRLNSWKHGLTAEEILALDEDRSKLEALRAELWKQFQPEEGVDSVLVDLLVGYAWRLRRASVIEANLFADRLWIDCSIASFPAASYPLRGISAQRFSAHASATARAPRAPAA